MEIKLKKAEIKKAIAENFGGGVGAYGPAHYLIVRPNGSHRITACERQCWQDDDYVAGIPAPYGDGSAELSELADEMLEAEGLEPADDEGAIAAADRLAPDSWLEWQDEALDWYAEEFLRALNGEFNDLDIDAAFGTREVFEPEHNIEIVECPFSFEWAE
jgi:hypothetical protein